MPHLWFRDAGEVWSVMLLNGQAVDVTAIPPRPLAEDFRLGEDATAALVCAAAGDSPAWVLLVAPNGEVRVNGFVPVAGARVLQHRDEIRLPLAEPLFFSTESLAHTVEFAAGEHAVFCGRCRQPMREGELAVRCPSCGIFYHETSGLACWSYARACAFCPQSTSLDAGFAWTPEA